LVKQATMPAPPLPRLRQDIPRSLALTVHSLLAKRPEDRPRTAASAKALLERSLVKPDRTLPDIQPLSSMVAASTPGNGILFRVGAPLVLVTTFGALLAWGYTGQSASAPRIPKETLPISNAQLELTPASYRTDGSRDTNDRINASRDVGFTADAIEEPRPPVVESISLDQARKTAAKFATGTIGAVAICETDGGPAIVAVDSRRRSGKTSFLLLEKRNGKFRVTSQQPLDGKGFTHASWTAELVDSDEDGFQDLLFSGKDSDEGRNLRRLVLFVPNDRRTYSLQMTGETTAQGTPRIQWLPNAAGAEAAVYRTALRQKARAIVSKKK
ncbi:MAG TPA: hypothetical protein VFR51_01015, partial [Pyrinomonadaceae bacterium]|nr:hypothetical protein [Pyrinomonadaceae bacterium]